MSDDRPKFAGEEESPGTTVAPAAEAPKKKRQPISAWSTKKVTYTLRIANMCNGLLLILIGILIFVSGMVSVTFTTVCVCPAHHEGGFHLYSLPNVVVCAPLFSLCAFPCTTICPCIPCHLIYSLSLSVCLSPSPILGNGGCLHSLLRLTDLVPRVQHLESSP